MRFAAVLNREGGSLRNLDLEAFSRRMREVLQQAGHQLEIEIVSGPEVVAALERAVGQPGIHVVIAGGGDGTVSAAAARLVDKDAALAILPAGTMNLFARCLGIPLILEDAVAMFANGRIRAVDVASMNGIPFVHQYSLGMHARMIRLREKWNFHSRLGKIQATLLAFYAAVSNPPRMEARINLDGNEIVRRASAVGVSNNLFGEGHLPYPDDPAGGKLGIYVTVAREPRDLLKLFLYLLIGRWRGNAQIETYEAGKVTIEARPLRRRIDAALDGELINFERESSVEIRPGSLRVLVGS